MLEPRILERRLKCISSCRTGLLNTLQSRVRVGDMRGIRQGYGRENSPKQGVGAIVCQPFLRRRDSLAVIQDIVALGRIQPVELQHGGVLVAAGGRAVGHVEGGGPGYGVVKGVGEEEEAKGPDSMENFLCLKLLNYSDTTVKFSYLAFSSVACMDGIRS